MYKINPHLMTHQPQKSAMNPSVLASITLSNSYAYSAECSPIASMPLTQMARGGIDRAIRGAQRSQPNFPCSNHHDLAPSSRTLACIFGGNCAVNAYESQTNT